jgi:NADPH2:quinone reductase
MRELFDLYAQGKLKPLVSKTYPLDRFAEAFAAIAARKAIGKLALKLR